jgi:hypothetical protein
MSPYPDDALSAQGQWGFSGSGMVNLPLHGLDVVEHGCLPSYRVKSYLADPAFCFSTSVEGFQLNGQRRTRALAEIDGVIAGLKFLDKIEKDHDDDPYPSRELSAVDYLVSDLNSERHWSRQHRQVFLLEGCYPLHKSRMPAQC